MRAWKIQPAIAYDLFAACDLADITVKFAANSHLGGIAQLVEHWPFKPLVLGSNPSAPTILMFK